MNETVLWHTFCEDLDCMECERGKVLAIACPLDWNDTKVVRYLQAQGYSCAEGNMIYFAQAESEAPEFLRVKANPNWK